MSALVAFLSVEKSLSFTIDWVVDGRNLRFTRTVVVNDVVPAGITLIGRASAALPDCNVSFGWRWQDARGRGGQFDRLDWRPMQPHFNGGDAPERLRLTAIAGSHHHRLDLNARTDAQLWQSTSPRGNLPVAEALDPEPAHWRAFLAVAGRRWQLLGLEACPLPPWQGDLLMR